jgi:hypothetical protein
MKMSKEEARILEEYTMDFRNNYAADAAQVLDREFFEKHPDRTVRVRKAILRELPDFEHLPEEMFGLVFVLQLKKGSRCRFPFPTLIAPSGTFKIPSDEQIDQLFPEEKLKAYKKKIIKKMNQEGIYDRLINLKLD